MDGCRRTSFWLVHSDSTTIPSRGLRMCITQSDLSVASDDSTHATRWRPSLRRVLSVACALAYLFLFVSFFFCALTCLAIRLGAVDIAYDDGDFWERAPVAYVVEIVE